MEAHYKTISKTTDEVKGNLEKLRCLSKAFGYYEPILQKLLVRLYIRLGIKLN